MGRLWEVCLAGFCIVVCLSLFTEALDCRRFVFAPMCRGVSAKRSTLPIENEDTSRDSNEGVDDTFMEWPKSSHDVLSRLNTRSRKEPNQILKEILEKYKNLANVGFEGN